MSGSPTMSIRLNESRERRLEYLQEATDENTAAGAIDVATEYYLEMAGDTTFRPTGAVQELLERAVNQGYVTAPEIAEILDTDAYPVEYSPDYHLGHDG